mmetsp:Transcript_98977/g.255893  ORF Transcript_98977/g.255893 Transcript_98977/m.255893 type:complete len:289 (-) Transcript_98977:67-933(-)
MAASRAQSSLPNGTTCGLSLMHTPWPGPHAAAAHGSNIDGTKQASLMEDLPAWAQMPRHGREDSPHAPSRMPSRTPSPMARSPRTTGGIGALRLKLSALTLGDGGFAERQDEVHTPRGQLPPVDSPPTSLAPPPPPPPPKPAAPRASGTADASERAVAPALRAPGVWAPVPFPPWSAYPQQQHPYPQQLICIPQPSLVSVPEAGPSTVTPPPPPPPPPPPAGDRPDRLGAPRRAQGAPLVTSAGTVGHPIDCGEACKYAKKPRGCKDGAQCVRCHSCDWNKHGKKRLV